MSLDNLKREIAETKTVIASARTLIASLAQRLRDALSSPNSDAALQALADDLDAEQAALAAAIAANTVADSEPPPPGGNEV